MACPQGCVPTLRVSEYAVARANICTGNLLQCTYAVHGVAYLLVLKKISLDPGGSQSCVIGGDERPTKLNHAGEKLCQL